VCVIINSHRGSTCIKPEKGSVTAVYELFLSLLCLKSRQHINSKEAQDMRRGKCLNGKKEGKKRLLYHHQLCIQRGILNRK